MILFRVLRLVIGLAVIFIILLLLIKMYEEYKVKRVLKAYGQDKIIALTFDDGPVAGTREVVDMLKELNIKATFFVLGDETSRRPDVLKYAYDNGHAIGNHSWNHPHLLGFRMRDYIEYQVYKAEDEIKKAIGTSTRFFRAPFGEMSPWLNTVLERQGMTQVYWTLALKDWPLDTTREHITEVFKDVEESEVILLHDRAYADPEKLSVLRETLIDLQNRGFTFVTIPELYR